MLTTIRYVLLTALRDRLFFGLLIGVAFATYIAAVLGSTAMIEMKEMTLSLSAGSARMILMVGLIVFVCFHLRHAFDTKEMDVLLSRPLSRTSLVVSYWLGFAVVALLLVIPIGALLAWLGILNKTGYALWMISLALESLLVVAVALFASFTLRSGVSSVLASLGLYVLMRMMGFFIASSQSSLLNQVDKSNIAMKYVLKVISVVVPRLDLFGNTQWLLYGAETHPVLSILLPQTVIFIPLLLVATMLDFRRRQF